MEIGHDILFKSAISGEILNTDVFGRIQNPFYYPSLLSTHHVAAEAVTAFIELPFRNWNVINFCRSGWFLMTAGLGILLLENVRATGSCSSANEGKAKLQQISNALAPIVVCLFLLSLIGGFGKNYSIIAYFNYNPESWWGAFFIFSAFIAVIKKHYSWAFYMLFCSACFKISLLPSVTVIGVVLLIRIKRFKSLSSLYSLFPIVMIIFLIVLSIIDGSQSGTAISFRNSLLLDFKEVKSWTLEFYLFISEPLTSILPYRYKGLCLIIIQMFFPVVLLLMCGTFFKFFTGKMPERLKDVFLNGILFIICSAFPVLMFKTVSRVHFSVDPWITGIWISTFIGAFIISIFTVLTFSHLKARNNFSKRLKLLAVPVLLAMIFFIRPDLMMIKKKYFRIDKQIGEIEDAIIKDNMYYASFLGKRIHRIAGNPYGSAFSLTTPEK